MVGMVLPQFGSAEWVTELTRTIGFLVDKQWYVCIENQSYQYPAFPRDNSHMVSRSLSACVFCGRISGWMVTDNWSNLVLVCKTTGRGCGKCYGRHVPWLKHINSESARDPAGSVWWFGIACRRRSFVFLLRIQQDSSFEWYSAVKLEAGGYVEDLEICTGKLANNCFHIKLT